MNFLVWKSFLAVPFKRFLSTVILSLCLSGKSKNFLPYQSLCLRKWIDQYKKNQLKKSREWPPRQNHHHIWATSSSPAAAVSSAPTLSRPFSASRTAAKSTLPAATPINTSSRTSSTKPPTFPTLLASTL